jgi:hypothetical protein
MGDHWHPRCRTYCYCCRSTVNDIDSHQQGQVLQASLVLIATSCVTKSPLFLGWRRINEGDIEHQLLNSLVPPPAGLRRCCDLRSAASASICIFASFPARLQRVISSKLRKQPTQISASFKQQLRTQGDSTTPATAFSIY